MKGMPAFAFCAILLFGVLSATAMCQDSDPRAGSASALESSRSLTADKATLQPDMIAAREKPFQLLEQDKVAEAITAQRQFIAMFCDRVGKSHWRVPIEEDQLSAFQRVAQLSQAQRRTYVTAREDMVDGLRRLSGGDYENAERALEKALPGLCGVLGNNCLAATTLEGLGCANLLNGNPSKAKDYLPRAAAAWKAVLGDQHPTYSNVLVSMGAACLFTRDFEQAEAALREALPIERKTFGRVSFRCANVIVTLSRVMIEKKKWLEAEAFCLEAASIVEELRIESVLGAAILSNTAEVEIGNEEYESAEDPLCRALALYEMPPRDIALPETLDRYAWLLRKLDRPEEAAAVEKRAESLRVQIRVARERMKAPRT